MIYGQDTIRGKDWFVITEGVGDCLALHCAGIPAISPITTQFPKHDIPKLLELAERKRVYICNDNDIPKDGETIGAGERGAVETAKILEKAGITTFIVILPKQSTEEKIDVAEYLRDNSIENFTKLLTSEHALGLWDYKLSKIEKPTSKKSIDKLRDFKAFIENDLVEMKKADWEIFVTNEVREKFRLSKDEIKTVVKDISDRRNKAAKDNSERGGDKMEANDPLEAFPEWAVNQANYILDNEDAFQFILDTWQKKHVGDTNISENCLCSVITSRILNSKRGLHIKPSGESGKGKSSAIGDFLTLLPDGFYISGSMSAKALFYDPNLKPGTIVYSDDASFSDDVISTIKQSTSDFQKPTFHITVVNGEYKKYPIPERVTFWFSAVEGMDDDQLANRFLQADVDSSSEQDKKVNQHQKDSEMWYESDIIEPDVLICRCIFAILFSETYRVKIPFIEAVTWNNSENRRNFEKFTDILRAVTIYNFRKREDFDGFLMATTEDFERALKIYKGTSVNNATNLTNTELKYIKYITTAPYATVSVKMLVKRFNVSDTAVRNILNGKKGKGGLLAKVPQLIVIDHSKNVKTGECANNTTKEKLYQYVGDWTGFEKYESIASLDYNAVERVTQEFKATLHENMLRVTKGNPEGNLSKVTPKNNNSSNNNIIYNNRVTLNTEYESGIYVPPSHRDVNNSKKTSELSQGVSPAEQGYLHGVGCQTITKTEVTHIGEGKVMEVTLKGKTVTTDTITEGYPSNDIAELNEGYPSMLAELNENDIEMLSENEIISVYCRNGCTDTVSDYTILTCFTIDFTSFVRSECHGMVLDIPTTVKGFLELHPDYEKNLGYQNILDHVTELNKCGWN